MSLLHPNASDHPRALRAILTGVVAIIATVSMATTPALAAPGGGKGKPDKPGNGGGGDQPTAIVAMGDSYISGEGGRWAGNSNSSSADVGGTDRATYKRRGQWYSDPNRVYVDGTYDSGCNRSDVAPALSAPISVDAAINLACSGAETQNVRSSSSGGQAFKGEAPQADQLAGVAAEYDVEMIVLSIGGNDLGFSSLIIDCTVAYLTSSSWFPDTCHASSQATVDARMNTAMAGVAGAIADVHAVMAAAGDTDYRLVLQSYPSPVPRSSENRYVETGWDRTSIGGCPFWDVDSDWARDSFVPQVSASLAAVAAAGGAEFLDLSDMLQGREVCSTGAALGSGGSAEWARFVVTGFGQGDTNESMHPNALGQRAQGTCLGLLYSAAPGNYRCTNTGSGPSAMNLTSS